MFSTIYLRLEDLPHPVIELSQVSEVNECILQPIPLSITYLSLKKKLVNFNFIWAFENIDFQVGVWDFQHTLNQACHTYK